MKRTHLFCWVLFVFILVAFCGDVSADTIVGGLITSDVHWTAAGSPYIANQSVVVANNAVLTIDQNVEVRFAPKTALAITSGQLIARGTELSPIRFTANVSGPVTDAVRWGYIGFGNESIDATFDADGNYTGGSIIEHAIVEYAGGTDLNGAIRADNAAPYVNHSLIQKNSKSGVYGCFADGLHITGNTITDNSGFLLASGLYLSGCDNLALYSNTITNNTVGSGVYLSFCDNAFLNDNTISKNSSNFRGGGVSLSGGRNVIFTNNTITENSVVYGDAGGLYLSFVDNLALTGDRILENTGDGVYIDSFCDGLVLSGNPDNPTWIFGNDEYQVFNNMEFANSISPDGKGNVDARNVWWDTTDEAAIQEGIYDFWDDTGKGIVFYSPFVPEPATLTLLGLGGLALIYRRRV